MCAKHNQVMNIDMATMWAAYQMSFEYLVEQWRQGIFTRVRPSALMPYGGLFQTLGWSQQRGEAKQAELVGTTTPASAFRPSSARLQNLHVRSKFSRGATCD